MKEEEKTKVERRRKYQREYYLKNLERCRKYNRKYMNERYAEDKEFRRKADENTKSYRNTPKGKEYVKKYNAKPEVRKRLNEWFAKHPHYRTDNMRNRLKDTEYRKKFYRMAKEWRSKNKDKMKESNKKYREKNRDKINKKNREYYKRNKWKLEK